ncbi:hypothetical protein K3729_14915 [Rhodobacteraceae bacterium S2214]|nr:hypothetical protein K3729_14915 [Rhodobacteraceae bacterium S2214]
MRPEFRFAATAILAVILTPSSSAAEKIQAVSCFNADGEAFIVVYVPTIESEDWWLDDSQVSGRFISSSSLELINVETSTMLILEEEDRQFVHRGLWAGKLTSGPCHDISEPFSSALKLDSTISENRYELSLSEQADLREEVLRQSSLNEIAQQQVATLVDERDEWKAAAIRLEEEVRMTNKALKVFSDEVDLLERFTVSTRQLLALGVSDEYLSQYNTMYRYLNSNLGRHLNAELTLPIVE